ncbi:MAG: hypothetical protein CVU71_10000 [Deltaproteobacteria bacterium HGW-Deltaproteobacteria-6]|nr:MAG: hypothetical protein CVU71_10000 [Deltaproteobacteria bacterium HGW-Deltaproteobacteria-6]
MMGPPLISWLNEALIIKKPSQVKQYRMILYRNPFRLLRFSLGLNPAMSAVFAINYFLIFR